MAANSALIEDLLRQYTENPRRVFARLANELRKSGDYDRAIEICRGQIPHQPGYISGHIVLGQSLYDSGRLEDARQSFETALNLDPENLIALRHLGDIARQHGETDVARGWYRRLLDVDPQNDEVIAQLEAMGAETALPQIEPTAVAEAIAPSIDISALEIERPAQDEPPGMGPVDVEIEEYRVESAPAATSDAVAEHEPLDIETADAFEPTSGAEKAFPDLEQSLEVSSIGNEPPPGLTSADARSMLGDSILDEARSSEEPRDAVDAYYPMLDVQAGAPSPAAFVTETMAELYLQQGYAQEALDIYRQLAEQNPADVSLGERVRQLEQGSRSSVGIAAISDDIIAAAHKRATTRPKKTIRQFFARLAMRRVVDREAQGPVAFANDEAQPDESIDAYAADDEGQSPTVAALEAQPVEEADTAPRHTAPELEEPEWLRSDPAPSSSGSSGEEPFALLESDDLRRTTPPREEAVPGGAAADIPWLDANSPGEPNEPADSVPSAEAAIPPSELFPAQQVPTEDENAAATLASVFEPEFAARLTPVRPMSAQQAPDARGGTPATGSPATRKADEDLSLDQVFGRTPASGAPQTRGGSSFDEFFDEPDAEGSGENKEGSSEIELFNTWLDQLKK